MHAVQEIQGMLTSPPSTASLSTGALYQGCASAAHVWNAYKCLELAHKTTHREVQATSLCFTLR